MAGRRESRTAPTWTDCESGFATAVSRIYVFTLEVARMCCDFAVSEGTDRCQGSQEADTRKISHETRSAQITGVTFEGRGNMPGSPPRCEYSCA